MNSSRLCLVSFLALAASAPGAFAALGVPIPGGSRNATYVISSPGHYFLLGDRTMTNRTKPAIRVDAPDVTLDLNGFAVRFVPSSDPGTGVGIAGSAVLNLEIRNGSIIDAPASGVLLAAEGLVRCIDVRIMGAGSDGILVSGGRVLIDRCSVQDSGRHGISLSSPGPVITRSTSHDNLGSGIYLNGSGAHVAGNSCQQNGGSGIRIEGGNALVSDNLVTGNNPSQASGSAGIFVGAGSTTVRGNHVSFNGRCGIFAIGSDRNVIEGNAVTATSGPAAVGIAFSLGGASNVAAGNRLASNSTPIAGAYTDGGGNVAF